jgi:hypothetical protein
MRVRSEVRKKTRWIDRWIVKGMVQVNRHQSANSSDQSDPARDTSTRCRPEEERTQDQPLWQYTVGPSAYGRF